MNITADKIQNTREKFYRNSPLVGYTSNNALKREIRQTEFLAELDPNGHKINDPNYYEDIWKKIPVLDKDDKPTGQMKWSKTAVERVAVPIQRVIRGKHLTHIAGEKIKFVLHNVNPNKEEKGLFVKFKQGWEKKNMETAKYDFMESVKTVGDAAFCAVMTDGEFSYRVFSAINGDTLHPIRDFNGNLRVFGRSFSAYDYERDELVPYLEVWDDKYYTLLSYDTDKKDSQQYIAWDSKTYTWNYSTDYDGWSVVKEPVPHGFKKIPIVYAKDETGACWSPVQDLIDKLEMALSQLFENNKSYAFRIMVVKGDVEIQGDLTGQTRAIAFDDKDGDAKFMEKADASSSFELQLKETLKYILMGSFTVLPPDNITGDLSGIALKIRYSPAIEQGMNDKNFFNVHIDKIVDLFKEGYGIEQKNISAYNSLDLRGDIVVYIHQNDSELVNNLTLSVQNGSLSRETAVDILPYSAADEMSRLENQQKKDAELELAQERASFTSRTSNQDDGMNDTNMDRQIRARNE